MKNVLVLSFRYTCADIYFVTVRSVVAKNGRSNFFLLGVFSMFIKPETPPRVHNKGQPRYFSKENFKLSLFELWPWDQ